MGRWWGHATCGGSASRVRPTHSVCGSTGLAPTTARNGRYCEPDSFLLSLNQPRRKPRGGSRARPAREPGRNVPHESRENSRVHHSVNGHLGHTHDRGDLCHGQEPDLFERRLAPVHLPTPSFPGREHCLPFFPTTAPGRATPVRSSSRHHVGVSCFTTDTSVFRVEPSSSKRKTIRRLGWGLGSKKVRMMFSGGYKWSDLIKQDPREPVRNHAEGHSPRSCNHRPKAL